MKIEKLFDKNGEYKLRFAVDATDQITEFLSRNNTTLDEGMKYAKEVDSYVFGKALEFPCIVKETKE
jgi:hypothetical protein